MYTVLEYSTACAKMHWNNSLVLILWLYQRDGKKSFILSTFVDDIQVAIKAGKSDQFYEQLNGVYPKVINFMVEVEQGDAIIFLYLWW